MAPQTFKYSLDKTSKKFTCPQCGHKTLVRYKEDNTDYMPPHVGRCDRQNNCAYHYTPKQYFAETNPHTVAYKPKNTQPPKVDIIPLDIVKQTLKGVEKTSFVQYLSKLFGSGVALNTAEIFSIGRSKQDGGRAVIFWQADRQGFIRSGKIVAYNAQTGKRIKETEGLADNTGLRDYKNNFVACLGVHPMVKKQLKNPNLNLRAGFFWRAPANHFSR